MNIDHEKSNRMTNNNARPDATSAILQMSLGYLKREELQVLLAALNKDAMATVKLGQGQDSVWFNLVAAIVNKSVRASKTAQNVVELARCTADRAFVREQMAGRYRDLLVAGASDEEASSTAKPEEKSLDIEQGIRRVYELVLHRTPNHAEIDIWKTNLTRGLPFHQFFLLIEGGDEATRLRTGNSGAETDGEFIQTAMKLF